MQYRTKLSTPPMNRQDFSECPGFPIGQHTSIHGAICKHSEYHNVSICRSVFYKKKSVEAEDPYYRDVQIALQKNLGDGLHALADGSYSKSVSSLILLPKKIILANVRKRCKRMSCAPSDSKRTSEPSPNLLELPCDAAPASLMSIKIVKRCRILSAESSITEFCDGLYL